MRRICCFCKSVYGEKCGSCGSIRIVRDRVLVEGADGKNRVAVIWKCLDCNQTWQEGSQKDTHGVCRTCESLRRQEAAT